MKRLLAVLALAAVMTAPAIAQTAISVPVPANVSDPAVAQAYAAQIRGAIRKVCSDEVGPMLGFNIYAVRACITDTSADVAGRDPTGVLTTEKQSDKTLTVAAR
jgi:UrcA family protein